MNKHIRKFLAVILTVALVMGFGLTGVMAENSIFWNTEVVGIDDGESNSIAVSSIDAEGTEAPSESYEAVTEEDQVTDIDSDDIAKEPAAEEAFTVNTVEKEIVTDSDQSAEIMATISGSFDSVSGKDIATIRYYTDSAKTSYAFADFSYNSNTGKYDYSFTAPYSGFTAVQGTTADDNSATVIAHYYDLNTWDGAVDVSWYDETSTDFYLSNPAQLAGLAAIVNGSIDGTTYNYEVKGTRSDLTGQTNDGLPDYIENVYYESTSLIAGVTGECHKGIAKHDFANRTVHLTADMNMGGVEGSKIDHSANASANTYSYPNWTPIGGEYLMDVADDTTMIIASFNGTLDGGGHDITNLYCFRWSYNHPEIENYTAYGYAQGTGLIGMMASLYDGESEPTVAPSVRNLSLSGYIYGRRMVGGIVGCVGGGSNAASGTSIEGGICFENLANHAYVYCTDSKGIGGIVATCMTKGTIVNCYNTGNLTSSYACPMGGILGSNEETDIYCCYNTGTVACSVAERGRGIGSDSGGKGYTVDNCYYLEGCGNDTTYPGYYWAGTLASVSVNTTEMTVAQMKSSALLEGLNANGTAYVAGDDGYPVLYWEKNSGTGKLTVASSDGGTVTASATGSMANGTVVYLSNTNDTGWVFRNYVVNSNNITADCVTVNGDTSVSGLFESAQAGVLKIAQNNNCTISVTKTGTVMVEGTATAVEDYPVVSGDSIYEGDILVVSAAIIDGKVPSDPSYIYAASAGESNPFTYSYTYTGKSAVATSLVSYTVTSDISGDGVQLTLDVIPKEIHKRWTQKTDISWYSDSATSFTLTTAEQLAGLDELVEGGNDFAGKTILLGNDISLANDDGTEGIRYWDGIGNDNTYFAGTFNGQSHKITDMTCDQKGLFAYVCGTADANAVVKNVSVWGSTQGSTAAGIVSKANYTQISGCSSYVCIEDGTSYTGGILAYDTGYSTISDCFNYGSTEGSGSTGGIVGELKATSTVSGCINTGEVNGEGTTGGSIGGVVGSLSGKLSMCANYGDVISWGRYIGGVAGKSVSTSAEITDCYNIGKVSCTQKNSTLDAIGGIVGFGSYYIIANSYNYGQISVPEDFTSTHIGGIIGQEGAKSTSSTSKVYFLSTSCNYAEDSKAVSELVSATYTAGMKSATASEFASKSGVLAGINGNSSYVLTNSSYPELSFVSTKLHVHSGGTATCCKRAVCEVCGLSYGTVDTSTHGETVVKNAKSAIWTTNGYTGDTCCADCGTILVKGSVIVADTSKEVLTVTVKRSGKDDITKTYTVAQLDAIKTEGTIGYGYGAGDTELMAATEYVTIETIIGNAGYTMDSIESLQVVCDSSSSVVTGDTLRSCIYYFDSSGNKSDAPAALAIKYSTYSGTLAEAAAQAQTTDALRFGYGISQEQYDNNTSLGGKRCVSPVDSLVFTVTGEATYSTGDVNLDGEINAYDLTAMARHLAKIESITDTTALSLADTDGDGTFDADDLTHLAQYLAKIITEL